MEVFYERLSQLCKLNGTSVTEVACTYLGVASSAATNWRRGASPRSDIVIRAAKHFGVTADYLLGLTDAPTPTSAMDGADPVLRQASDLLRCASGTARSVAIAAMKAVIEAIDKSEDTHQNVSSECVGQLPEG